MGITASGVNHKKGKGSKRKMQALLESIGKEDEDSYEKKS